MAATKNPLGRLGHMRDEIEGITVALRGATRDAFAEDYLLRRAAERAADDYIGGGKGAAERLDRSPSRDRLAWHGRARRRVAHDYERVDADTLWKSPPKKLPELAPVIARMINDLDR